MVMESYYFGGEKEWVKKRFLFSRRSVILSVMASFWDKLNTVTVTTFTVISGILTWALYRDHSQLEELKTVAGKIDSQLQISQAQLRVQNHFDSVRQEADIYRLQILANQVRDVINTAAKKDSPLDTTEARSHGVREILRIFENELQNPVILEDTIFLVEWVKFYKRVQYVNFEIEERDAISGNVYASILYNYSVASKAFLDKLYAFLDQKVRAYHMRSLRYLANGSGEFFNYFRLLT